jgi:CheY-like chemotaxis protein
MKILIAEDDPTNQQIARIWLTRGGHSVTIVSDGQSWLTDIVLNRSTWL